MKFSVAWTVFALVLSTVAESSNITGRSSSQQILQGDFKVPQVFENANLVRNTNLEKNYVRETINVVVTNTDSKPQSEYYIPFEYDVIGNIGGFEVRDKKNADKGRFDVSQAALAAVLDEGVSSSQPTQYFVVHFPEPLAPKEQITLSISYHVLGSLKPLPASIKQDQKQHLAYSFSAYYPSAYVTKKQKTKLKFPTADIPEYTTTTGLTESTDPERQGSSFTYGPYDTAKIPPGTTHPVTVRYEFTKPIIVATLLERDVEVSHWGGNLATEERYWLRNDGATLKDNFNRVAWAAQNFYSQTPTSALKELKVPLKPGSVDPYFTDDIGNVSTSRYRPNSLREASLELKPRYPVFGGWKYSFRIGWNNALGSFLRKLKTPSDGYVLSVPLIEGPRMTEGVSYERAVIRVILPEGAKNVKWETYGGTGLPLLNAEEALHKTFMDTSGRTEIKLSAINVVDEARDITLLVTYEYPFFAAFKKPLSIFGGVSAVFITAWLVGRIDTSIGRKGLVKK